MRCGLPRLPFEHFFYFQLPFGPPPIFPELRDDIEDCLLTPEDLPIHAFQNAQQYVTLINAFFDLVFAFSLILPSRKTRKTNKEIQRVTL